MEKYSAEENKITFHKISALLARNRPKIAQAQNLPNQP